MKRLVPMFDNSGARYSIPEDRVDEFRADMGEVAEAKRYRGKDGQHYTIPQEQEAAFRADMPDAVPVRSYTMADGSKRDFTMSEMSKFLRSKEYRESADYAEQRKALESQMGSPTWAAVKGALGGAAEGAYYGGKNALAKVATALPEAAASVGEAVGNAVNLGGNAKNAVGDWLRASGQQTKRWLGENIRGDQYDENGNLVMSGLTKDLGYEDALTKIGETAGDAAAMAVKFAPAAIAGPAYMETILASDGINAFADTFDRAKAAGYSDGEANLAGAASGLINYYGAKLMMKGGAATKGIANPLLRALGGTAFTGTATAAQAVGNKGVENAIESKPITEGMLGAAGEGFVEGAQFHLINEVGTNAKASMQIRRETREMKEMRKENLLTATETPDGRAFLNTVVQNDGVDAAIRARKDGKDISRKMGAAADLPDNMSAAERNAVIDGISKAREAQAERVRTKMDDVQAQALADEVGGVLPRGIEDPMFEEVWLGVTKRVRDATELDDPQRRAELVDEAINDVVGPQKSVQESNAEIMENRRLRTPTRVGEAEIAEREADRKQRADKRAERQQDIEEAFRKDDAQKASRKGQEQKAQRKAELDDYERQEQERIAREKAEQEAALEVGEEQARLEAEQAKARAEVKNAPELPSMREGDDYKGWLKKHGRKDSDKNWNRFVAERGFDPALKVERGHNGPNEETNAELEMGRRIEAEGEAQRKAAADKAQAEYDEKMAAYKEARAKREAEKKRYGRAKTELPEKPTPPELRVEKPQKPVIEADLSKKTAQVDKETAENAEIVSTKAENRGEVAQKAPDGRGKMVEKPQTEQPSQPLENAPSRALQKKGTTSQADGAEGKEARNGASSIDDFVSTMKPMVAAKAKKSLGSKRDYGIGNDHDVMTDAEFVEKQVGKGAVMTANVFQTNGKPKVEYVLGDTVITKTQSDYARHLGAKIDNNSIERAKEDIALKSAVDKVTDATNGSYSPYEASDENIAKHIAEFEKRDEKALRKLLDIRPDMKAEYDALKSIRDARIKRGDWSIEQKTTSTRVPDGKGRMVKKPSEQVSPAPTAQADGVTPALRERLSKTEIGRSILGNYDANVKDDPKFALEQLKRSVEANKAEIDGEKPKGEQKVVQPNLFGKSPSAPADRTSDPAIVEWAKKRGISVVNGKVSQATVERYLKDRVGKAVNATKRLFSDAKVEVKDREWSEELDGTGNVLKDNEGRVVGTFDLASKKVTLYRGADESTVYHELIGHGVEDWARRNDANLHKKLLDVAATAPKEVIDEIRKNYPGADNETVAKEIIAKIASGRAAEIIKLKDAPKRWYAKAYVAVRDALVSFMQKLGLRRIDLSRIDRMTPNEVMDHLMREIRSGKTLGKLGAEKNGEVMKSERFLNNYYDRHTSVKRMSERAWEEKHVQPGMEAGFEIELKQKESEYKDLLEKGNVANFEVGDYMKAVAAKERNANDRAEHVKQLQDGGKLKGKSEREIDLIVKKMNDGTAGITDEEADATIAHYKSHPRFKEIEKAADFLWKVQDEGMKRRVKSGLYSQEEYDAMKAAEPHHVPFRTAIDETTGEHIPWRGLRNLTGSEHAHHEGRFSRSGDPATFIFDEFTDAHIRSIENDTRRVLAEEVAKDATLGKIVTDPSIKESRVNGDGGTRNAVSYKTSVEIMEPVMEEATYKRKDGTVATKRNKDGSVMMRQKKDENGNVVMQGTGRFKTVTRTILLAGERGELAASSYTNRDLAKPKWMDKEVSVLGFGMSYRKFMRGYSATATEWSGSFAVMNAVKDKVDVAKIVLVEKGVKEGSAWLKDFSKAHVDTAGEIAEFIRTGKIRKGSTLETYVNSGAMIGGLTRQGMNEITKDLSHEQIVKALKQGKSKTRAVALALPRVVKALNQYAELSTRVAAFKTELAHNGGDVRKAALWSRDITTDFNRKGNYTPVLNNIFMFSNATIGAKMRQYQALKTGFENGNYGAIVGIATASAVFATAEHIINSDDDKREAEGKAVGRDVSEYRRKTSMGLRVGSTHYGIPEHDDPISQIGYNVGLVTRAMLGDADWSTVAKELGSEAFGEVTSLLGVGSMDPSAGISSFFPSPIQPFIQDKVGKNFMGSDIRRPKFDDSLPNWANGRKSTGSQYKWAAKKLSDLTGGNDGRGGWIDVNPDTLKHYWETLGKNLGKDVAFLCETGFNIARGKVDVKANDVPAVRGIVRTYEGNDNRFYEAKRGWEKDKKELSMTKDAMTDDEAMAFVKAHPLAASASATKSITGLETKIARLRKMESGFRFVKGKAQPHEWSDDQVKEMRDERFRLQAMYIKAMREQK